MPGCPVMHSSSGRSTVSEKCGDLFQLDACSSTLPIERGISLKNFVVSQDHMHTNLSTKTDKITNFELILWCTSSTNITTRSLSRIRALFDRALIYALSFVGLVVVLVLADSCYLLLHSFFLWVCRTCFEYIKNYLLRKRYRLFQGVAGRDQESVVA